VEVQGKRPGKKSVSKPVGRNEDPKRKATKLTQLFMRFSLQVYVVFVRTRKAETDSSFVCVCVCVCACACYYPSQQSTTIFHEIRLTLSRRSADYFI